VKLITNFAELLHKIRLPTPEKCSFLEEGDEKYIKKWVQNGELICDLEKLFDWINIEYKIKNKTLYREEKHLADEIRKRFLYKDAV
tara:strand:- start:487 stop:744 length:258 start_codon:yes stop_codon:yes gene_type:complete